MANTFNFELVSPERKLISEKAYQVSIPGEEGDIGVRAGHMALVMTVRAGVIEVIRSEGGASEKIFIAGGFADVSQTNCTILAEEAIPVANLNAEKLSAEMTNLKDSLSQCDSDAERNTISKKLVIVSAMLDALKVA